MRDEQLMSSSSPMPPGAAAVNDASKLMRDFVNMGDVIAGKVSLKTMVSVMGVVTGVQEPTKTSRGMTTLFSACLLSKQPDFAILLPFLT